MYGPKSRTLGELLDEICDRQPDKEAIIFKDKRYTYRMFQEEANRLAKSLLKLGLEKGDRVAMLFNNRLEWMLLAFAVVKAGGTLVALNTWYRTRELEYVLKHSSARMLFTVDEFTGFNYVSMVKELGVETGAKIEYPTLPELKQVVVLGEPVQGFLSWEEVQSFGSDLPDSKLLSVQEAVKPHDVAFVLYTSGTTSRPKAVQLLHYGLIENGFNIGERQKQTQEDRLWVGIPMFFSFFSANAMLTILTHGGSIVIQERFEPSEAIELISKERCTIYYGMPNITIAIYNHKNRAAFNLSSLRSGAIIGPPEAIRLTAELVPKICNVYGLTETYGNCVVCDADDPIELRCTSQGKPLPGNEIKIVDTETGCALPQGNVGEVCVKGYVTPGYLNDQENNAKAFDGEDYFHTGDLGYLDEQGRFHYLSRQKDMIKTGGINVSPAEVEDFLYSHPNIKEVHVVGVSDSVKGEVVMAVIELKDRTEATEEEIISYCKGKIAGYSIPKHVRFVGSNDWLRTASGKVPKDKLRDRILHIQS